MNKDEDFFFWLFPATMVALLLLSGCATVDPQKPSDWNLAPMMNSIPL